MLETRTEVHTTLEAVHALIPEWNALLHKSSATVFQTPEFLISWWETLGSGELFVAAFRNENDGALVGLAPLMKTFDDKGVCTICFIGCVAVSDYLDIIVDKKYQTEVYADFAQLLRQEKSWNKLFLCSLQEDSQTRNCIRTTFPTALETQQDVCPSIALPATWEEYLASLNRKQRHELKRKTRNLEAEDHELTCLTNPDEVLTALPEFIRLHELSSKEKQSFWSDEHRAFFQKAIPALAKGGYIKLFFLKVDGAHSATMLVFEYGDGYYLYNSGFDPARQQLSTGTVLTGYTIAEAIREKKKVYDFLRGNEEYKFRFGAVAHPVFDYDVVR